jgi:NAD(P)H-dependent flavin oxidoreductase YrpB (nitropropane dioxygenase family)
VDAVIAQGAEAGGHVKGKIALAALLPGVVDALRPLPVLASGGIGDGRGIAAALLLGAVGVSLGTRFVASEEAYTVREYKERIARAGAEDTVYSEFLFDGMWPDAPHRALRNGVVREWEAAGSPPSGKRPGEGFVIARAKRADGTEVEVKRYSSFMITPGDDVDIEEAPLWAGQSVSTIHEIKPAGDIVRDLAREADALL